MIFSSSNPDSCENVVYSNGQLVCVDTGEVIDDHPVAIDAVYNIGRTASTAALNAIGIEKHASLRRRLAKAIEMYMEGKPIREIVEATGITSMRLLYSALRSVGRRRRSAKKRRISDDEVKEIVRMHLGGASIYSIAKRMRRSPSSVKHAIDKMVEVLRSKFGEKAEAILKAVLGELTTWDLARMYGVSPTTAYRWVREARKILEGFRV